MCFLSASSDFEITNCQFNDVQGCQYFYINTFNNCCVTTTPSPKGIHQHSALNATPSAQQYGPIIPSDHPPMLPCRPCSLRGYHELCSGSDEQPTLNVRSCTCVRRSPPPTPSSLCPQRPMRPSNHLLDDPLVKHYLTCVINIQYLLANKAATATLICVTVQTNATVHEAVRLLAAVHQDKHRSGQTRSLKNPDRDSYRIYGKLSVNLLYTERALYTQEDAMAALLVVSSVLFDGGTGNWLPWLWVAYNYLDSAFKSCSGAANALQARANDAQFIFVVKTAFWFDVIASVTQRQRPHFYHEIDILFHPSRSTASANPLSMEDSIGCHNDIFWALNQASALSSKTNPFQCYTSAFGYTMELLNVHAQVHQAPAASYDGWSSWRYTSHMLCMATIVLLQSLRPDADSSLYIEGTQGFLQSLRNVPTEARTQRHIVRSSVFSIFICGLFVTRREDRQLLGDHLRQQSADNIGNCTAIVKLLKSIWQDHDSVTENGKWLSPVTWRGPLKDSCLLLV